MWNEFPFFTYMQEASNDTYIVMIKGGAYENGWGHSCQHYLMNTSTWLCLSFDLTAVKQT